MVRIVEMEKTEADLLSLIAIHAEYCASHTPEGSGHTLAPAAADLSDLRYWVAYVNDRAVGCIGLCPIDNTHAEIKTMHVLSDARGRGIGMSLVNRLVSDAASLGFERLSLETGKGSGFAASRALYGQADFTQTEPFGRYADDPFSFCMTRQI